MNISIFGAGYVGLITAACLAEMGHQICCADIDKNKIEHLQKGAALIHEEGLIPLLQKNSQNQRLIFTHDLEHAIHCSDILFICVGTPSDHTGAADLQNVASLSQTIADTMNKPKLIINKSTAPVGTSEQIESMIKERLRFKQKELVFDVCSNPEFLREGAGVTDFFNADRIIIGTESSRIQKIMTELYDFSAYPYAPPVLFMSTRAAEFTKYAANTMLATKISFINEMANIAELMNVDIEEVCRGIGSDHRIGFSFINPGCGFGGSCFPKDVKALTQSAVAHGYKPRLLEAVHEVNQDQKQILFQKVQQVFRGDLKQKTIALWGLAFKPGTNDIREASSLAFMESIWASGATIRAYDPIAMNEVNAHYGIRDDLYLATSPEDALYNAHILVICTEWSVFRTIPITVIKNYLLEPIVIDGRNIYDPLLMKEHGFFYMGIGRKNIKT